MEKEEKKQDDELPKLNPYDKTVFWKIHFPDLIADIGLITYSLLFSKYFVSQDNIIETIHPVWFVVLYAVIVLTMPWYLGYLYVLYSVYYGNFIKQTVKWIFIIIILFLLIYLLVIAGRLINTDGDTISSNGEAFGMFSLFLLVLGPMMGLGGLTAGYDEFRSKEKQSDFSVTLILLSLVIAIGLLVWLCQLANMSDRNNLWGFILMFIIFIGSSVGAVLFIGLMMALKSLMIKLGIYDRCSLMAQTTFPFFILTTLILWNEVGIRLIIENFGGGSNKLSLRTLLISLTLTGFIPFRLITLFAPPLKLINLIFGLLAFVFYVWNILHLAI